MQDGYQDGYACKMVTTLQECLFEAAIKTKFGRHYSECQPIMESLRVALTGMKYRWTEER